MWDPGEILQLWTEHFQSLLNNSSPTPDQTVTDSLPQLNIFHAMSELPKRGEVVLALRRVANAKAIGPGELSDELCKLGLMESFCLLAAFHTIILQI